MYEKSAVRTCMAALPSSVASSASMPCQPKSRKPYNAPKMTTESTHPTVMPTKSFVFAYSARHRSEPSRMRSNKLASGGADLASDAAAEACIGCIGDGYAVIHYCSTQL